MPKLKAFMESLASGFIVYFATLMGVLLSQYAPMLLTHDPITTFSWVRLGISMAIAFYLVAGQEEGGDIDGKRKHLKRRIANALAHGISWNTIIGIAGISAGQ